MLKRIIIKDFQSHRETTLDLDKGVNVIVGKTDSGKSSILRALSWLASNKCDDSNFIRTGAKSVSVEAEFDNGKITRSRVGKDNFYHLVQGKSKQEFKAFKQDIPADVVEFLNMNDVNVQSQLEAPFLLSQTSGEVAKTLNKLVDLSIIHESVSGIKKKVIDNNRAIETISAQIEENKEALEAFYFIPALEKKIKAYECLCKERIELETGISELAKVMSRYQTFVDKIDTFDEMLSDAERVDSILEDIEKMKKNKRQIDTLETLIERVEYSSTSSNTARKLSSLEPKVKEVIELHNKELLLRKEVKVYEHFEYGITEAEEKLDEMETEYIENMPEVCPICEREMLPVEQ